MAERPSNLVNPVELFRDGIPFEGEIDVRWFLQIPNADVASARLDWMAVPGNISELLKRGYEDVLPEMWKAVFRACIGYGVPIPEGLKGLAGEYGIVVPD
jgi:hypothetical protein